MELWKIHDFLHRAAGAFKAFEFGPTGPPHVASAKARGLNSNMGGSS